MVDVSPTLPWLPGRARHALRGRILMKIRNGEGPRNAPHYLQTNLLAAPLHFDRGRIDSAILRHTPAMQVTRAYQPSRAPLLGSPVVDAWDDMEERIGLSRTYRIEVDPDTSLLNLLDSLRSVSNVEMATPHYLCTTPFEHHCHPRFGGERPVDPFYAQNMVGVSEALSFEPGDSALQVGVVDSGVDLDHPELQAALRPGVDTVDLPSSMLSGDLHLVGDAEHPDRIPRDEIGHGTACASIISASGRRVPRGLAGAAQLVPARALAGVRMLETNHLTAMGSLPDIDQSVKTLVDLGVRVLNLSFGTPASALRDDDPRPHNDIIEYALQRGCILVAASGNDGAFQRYYPAAHPGVIAVGSVNQRSAPSIFTSRGDHVLISAPGENVMAATLNGEYLDNTGTSFAAPFVTGACALLISRAARYGRPIDVATVKSFLSAYARPFSVGSDSRGCGAGVLDVPASLRGLERALSTTDDQWLTLSPFATQDVKGDAR